MRYFATLCAIFTLNNTYSQNTRTSWLDGDASSFWVWTCFCVPSSSDNLVITTNIEVTSNSTYNDVTINNGGVLTTNGGRLSLDGDLIIESGGELVSDDRTDIYGNYTIDGIHSGSSNIRLLGDTTIMDGTGTISNAGRFQLNGDYKEFSSTLNWQMSSDRIQLLGSVYVLHKGRLSTDRIVGNSNRTWVNDTNSYLEVRNTISNNIMFESDAPGSEVVFDQQGTNNALLPNPINSSFYNLTIDGDSPSSRKKIRSDITILGDLNINGATFDVRQGGTDSDVDIEGNWILNGGNFDERNGTVRFTGSGNQNIIAPSGANFYNLEIGGNGIKSMMTPVDVFGNLTVNSTFDVNDTANYDLKIGGDVSVAGKIFTRQGEVTLNGSGNQSVSGDITFYNLTLNNSNGAVLSSGDLGLRNTLRLNSGNLNANGNLTLISDSAGTARIAEITGGSISGNMTMERYIKSGATNWRFLSSAVSGATLADWDNDFITSGFPGSDFPNFPFTSILRYDETKAGIRDTGYFDPSGVTSSINVGEGYLVWCGDSLNGTKAFTIDVVGPANTGNLSLPVTFTATGGGSNDGWNIVGNPYPSTIDWDAAGWTKTNMMDAIYIWDANLQQFASYVSGVGTNGGSRYIPSSQAFWVQADTTAPALAVTESVKAGIDQAFRREGRPEDMLRIMLSGTNYADETVLGIREKSTAKYDPRFDAEKIFSSNPYVPSVYTMFGDIQLSINQTNRFKDGQRIPLYTDVPVSGIYHLDFKLRNANGDIACFLLHDKYSGNKMKIYKDTLISVNLSDTALSNRYELIMGAPASFQTETPSCHLSGDGMIEAMGSGAGPWNYTWKDAQGHVLRTIQQLNGPDRLHGLNGGRYSVTIDSSGVCGSQYEEIYLAEPDPTIANFRFLNENSVLAGTAIRTENNSLQSAKYHWDFGDGFTSVEASPTHQYNTAGLYHVQLIASKSSCNDTLVKTIEVVPPTDIEELEGSENIRIYSYRNRLVIDFNNQEGSQVEVEVFDATGRRIHFIRGSDRQFHRELTNSGDGSVWIVRVKTNLSLASKTVFVNSGK